MNYIKTRDDMLGKIPEIEKAISIIENFEKKKGSH